MPPSSSPSTRVAIISDTHGVIDPEIIKVIEGCDQIIHAGDICGAHVLAVLAKINPNVTAVAGNNDVAGLWDIHEAHIVTALPQMVNVRLPGGTLAIEHGHRHGMHTPCHQSLRDSHPHARAIVYGHTHRMLVDTDSLPWVANPGAAGATRTRGGPSCLVLTASESNWHIEEFRFADALKENFV